MDFLTKNLHLILECCSIGVSLVVGIVLWIKNHHGKDIDGDGFPDVAKKFDTWFIVHRGERIYLKDMKFMEDPNEKKSG